MEGMQSPTTSSDFDNLANLEHLEISDQAEHPRKLAILGLPWDTSEETLRSYFSQFGPLEHAEVMKDRYTGKSRGFGFVTFADAIGAQKVLSSEHSIDGRRCEAKIALPKGDPTPHRTTRIFVARIPPSVTEAQFRAYFENLGKLQDAYMPKDHSKQGYRGIGFVTFASPDAVEKIMAVKHWLNGHEIAIDRATPKDEPMNLAKQFFSRVPLAASERRSFDNGSGIVGPGLSHMMRYGHSAFFSQASGSNAGSDYRCMSPLAEEQTLNSLVGAAPLIPPTVPRLGNHNLGLGSPSPLNYNANSAAAAAAAAVATTAALQSLANAGVMSEMPVVPGMGSNPMRLSNSGLQGMTPEMSANLISTVNAMGTAAAMQQLMAAAAATAGRRSFDSASSALRRSDNPAIVCARAGPRIFVGKLTKDTTEADLKEYFMKFGFVMDVYLPKAKDNKLEHRGFGFVTFETDAAIQRVVRHGTHRLKNSTIAIDIAMPKVDEEEEQTQQQRCSLDVSLDASPPFAPQLSMPMLPQGM